MVNRLSILNDPPKILEGPQLLHDLVDFDVHADACALDFSGNGKRFRYNYREIQSCAQSLAYRIREALCTFRAITDLVSQRQHLVPILLPQSPALYVAQLAILESGGAFCPINLDAPKERIKFVVGDVEADLIITTPEFKDVVSWENGPKVMLIDEFPTSSREDGLGHLPAREPQPRDLAYVMYTSGSSGTPKGVAVSHFAASQSLLAHERHIPPFKRFLQFAAPSFDVSVFEIFFPLKRGSTLVGCNRSQLLDNLPGMINELQVDAAELTPTVVGSLLQRRANAPGLKLLLTIGEMLTRPIVEEFGGSEKKESMLYGMYGPTEAAIHCTINPKMSADGSPSNIGVPFDTVSTFIAAPISSVGDGSIEVLSTGELGELVLGGPQLADGYLNRQEQNKAAFIHTGGKDYYRTGDKARLLENGTIEILGRISSGQVKLRGQRVELGEIEAAVYRHPGVKTASAAVISTVLVVFALVNNQSLVPEDILATCSKWLPKFMVPSEIILSQKFPYLPSGKVDKRKLESDYQSQRIETAGDDDFSATTAENVVRETIKGVLGTFSKNMLLAATGLDSLVAIRVATKLRQAGFNITTVAVLQAETPVVLARLCEGAASPDPQRSGSTPKHRSEPPPRIDGTSLKDIEFSMPCTPLQSAMLAETAVNEKAYRNWIELDLSSINDDDKLLLALQGLAQRNPILRTGFAESENAHGYVQLVWKAFDISRIETVKEFVYDFDPFKDSSLLRPIRIQIRHIESRIKLLIHIHHALYDAWSLELLMDDLDTLLMQKEPIQRPIFANLVDALLEGTIGSDSWVSRDYWQDHLAQLEFRRLPNFNTSKVSSQSLSMARLETSISTSEVEATARGLSSSPQSLFQAAYALILSSYLGSQDVCFGTVFSGRTLPLDGIEEIAGPCLSTLPVRIDVSTASTLQDLVQALNSTNRKHLEHSIVPLREIKSSCSVNPSNPLFDTLLIWQQTLHKYDQERTHVSLVDSTDNLEFNLTLEVIPSVGNIVLKVNYREALLPKSQVDIFLRQIEQLAKVILENCSISLKDVFGHLTSDLLSLENENPLPTMSVETLSSPVERIASEDPGRPAIDFAKSIDGVNVNLDRISYMELNCRSNQIGQRLLQEGVLPDELVCICMEKSIDLYTTILATAKVGAGYLPVAPDTPSERLQHILQEAKVKLVIVQSCLNLHLNPGNGLKVICMDDQELSALSSENIPPRSSPESLAYSVFTSGSTGTPKGVLVTQWNILSNLDVLEELYPANKNSRLLQSCSQAFDVSVFEIFFAWRIGACLCSATKDVLFRDIEKAIRLLHVTHLSLTPTVASLVDPRNVPEVEFLVTAGEAVTQKVFNAWSGRGLYQGYGPSETTNICTVNLRVASDDLINNIGPPLRNTSAFVLSSGSNFELLPRGAEGEFCFGGSQIFRGYVNRSQEAGKIIEHPTFGRLYRSGDFGRLMPDGCLVFTGRKDDQVKVRGQRVELGEINTILLRSPEVDDCITMVIDAGPDKHPQLISFWTTTKEVSESCQVLQPDQLAISRLYQTLESSIPGYMLPSALIPLSSLPSTSQGKIDKRALIRLYKALDLHYLGSTARIWNSPSDHKWSNLELTIAETLSNLTNVPLKEINADTSFFSLGIDSVSAISFSRTLRHITRVNIEISDILKYPSAFRLANKVLRVSQSENSLPNLAKNVDFEFQKELMDITVERFRRYGKDIQKILPCTPLQEAMLSAGESSSSAKLYTNEVSFDVRCDVERLQACWQKLVERHDMLRTCFISTDMPRYPYVQIVLPSFGLKFQAVESLDNAKHTRTEFEPPYSFRLKKISGASKLVLSIHHALYDGVALSILYEEAERLYHGDSLPLSPTFVPFLNMMTSLNMESSDQFWQKVLKDFRPSKFPAITQEASIKSNQIRIQSLHASSSLHWIEENVRRHNTTLLAVCHTIWASLISEHQKIHDVCFGNVVSGRTVPIHGIERLVAPCFNTIPSRLRDIHKTSYLEAFRKLQSLNADSLSFQFTPLRRIQSKFSTRGSRLFDTLFILQQPSRDLDQSIWSILEDNGTMDFPLVCEVIPKSSKDSLEIILHSHSSIITTDDVFYLLKGFDTKLQEALENPRRQLISSNVKEQITFKHLEEACLAEEEIPDVTIPDMTPDELRLRDVLVDFTNVSIGKIGRDVSIFRLGLDSISAVQLAARLRKLGHCVKGSDILEHSTIAKLNAFLFSNLNTSDEESEYDFVAFDAKNRPAICLKNNIPSHQIEAIRPCTTIQQGMIAQSIHSQGQEYVNSMWLELVPNSSLSAFKEAWKTASKEHEMLRTGFSTTDDPAHPFAMITYTKDGFELPWFEMVDDSNSKCAIVHQLSRPPWQLVVDKEAHQTLVKFTAHHALYDAQSVQMILSDVANTYASRQVSSRQSISNLLGRILIDSENNSPRQEFWGREENKIIVNRFPDLTPLRVMQTKDVVREVTSRASISELEEYCKDSSVTVQAAGQVAWARLLSAYIGERSTTFGMTLSGRSVHENADSISFPSIVTLPVRSDVTGTNQELLSRTMNSNALLHKHQFTPLTSIQKWAGYPEGKIFDTLFAYQKVPVIYSEHELPWNIIREEANVDYAVSLEVQPRASGQITLRITFKDNKIPLEHADLLLGQYDILLLDTLRNPHNFCDVAPDVGTHFLSITPAKEAILSGPVTLLHEFVERGARKWPDRKALEFTSQLGLTIASRSWTYNELNNEANKIAHLLQAHKVPQGHIVAICFDKCAEASIGIIGILKAGCSYVALDPQAPADRLSFIMKDSGAEIILSAGETSKRIQSWVGNLVIALDSPHNFANCSSDPPSLHRCIEPTDISYCLYTSGTTGVPKGCLISHENAVQAMLSFQRLFYGHWDIDSKWLQFASFHFDVSVLEQFWSWSVGICVASAPRDLIFEDIPRAIRQLGITHIDLTPSLARLLRPEDAPSLCKGVFITGGEQLKQEILDAWGDHSCIYNGYGPTEATIGVTMYPRVPKNGKPANIGPQFDNVGSFVLKPGTSLPVLRGGIGELCVSGKLVGKGYLNRPALTSERFPTLEAFGERLYRTGDLVRILVDGSFLFLGRADDQVKLRGQRLELSEINEVAKKSREDVQEVVTLVLKHNSQQNEQLVTFFVSEAEKSAELNSIISTMRYACQTRLPGYMVPTHFLPIKVLPLNANNKADAKQLAAVYNNFSVAQLQVLSRSGEQQEQWTNSEERIRGILAPLLHVHISALTRESTIFQLGLDSISVIGFSRNLQDAGFGNATLSLVKNNPAIGSLVQALLSGKSDKQQGGNDLIASIQNISAFSQKYMIGILNELGIDRSDIESLAPCTPVQEGMIYRFLERDQLLYFNHFEFILDQKVNIRKLFLAWQSLISRLQILRTKFVATDDGYAQVVLRKLDIDCEMPSSVYEATEKSIALKTPFHLHIINGAEKRMRMRIFHGLYDGNSLVILLHRLVDEYRGSQVVEYGPSFHSSLPNGPLAKVRGAQAFWKNHLLNWQDTKLPSKSPDIEKSIIATRIIPKLNGLEDFRKKIGVTHQAIIQAAWISVLHTISSPNLTIGMVVSGRAIEFEGADKVIGPLFNTVPFCTKIEPGMKLASLTSICHQFNMSMQDFQHTALKNIQKWVCVKPGQSLFDTLFVFQRAETNIDDFASDIWTRVDSEPIADYPLAFEATLNNDGSLAMTIAAQGSVIDTPEAETLLGHTETVILTTLKACGENTVPETTVNGQINLPSPVEGLESTTVPDNNFKDTAFVWTEAAHIMRMEIASLANIEEIEVQENSSIFQLGLDSIDVIKLSSRLKKHGIIISVSTIINSQSIVKMASNIPVNDPTDSKDDSSVRYVKTLSQDLSKYLVHRGLVLHEVETVLPATPLQQTMINEMLKSNFRRYFTLEVFSLDKNTDRSRLIAAVEAVVAESPILRTSFIEVDDPKLPISYAQVILKSHKLVKESIEPNLETFLSSFRAKSTASAVSDGTIFHAHVITVAEKSYLIWAISHALYDGASMELLHQDIDRAYRGKYSARPDCLPFLECILKSTTDEVENFWKTNLSHLPEANFPRKDVSQSSDPTIVHRLEMPSRVPLDNIEKLCRSSKVTLQTLGQTCWAIVLGHLTRQLDVVFGSVLSCRDSEESNEIMFPLMNTVIVRSILHGTLAEMLNYVQDMGDTTRQYQHFPLGRAQALALSSRNCKLPEDTTLFDTLFIYQGRRRHAVDRSLYKSLYGASDVEFPVCVEMEIIDNRLVWNTACKSTARDAIETNNMIEMLDTILHRLIANPDAPTVVSDVEGISICGLPQFRMTEASLEKATTSALTLDSRDWTSTELIIRKVLHDVSGVAEDLIHKDSTIFQLGLDSIIILKIPSLLRSHGISLSVSDILRGQTIFAMSKSALHQYSNQTAVTDVEAVLSAAVTSLEPAIVQNLRIQFGEIENIMPATAGQLYMIRMWQSSRGILFYPSFTYSVRGVDKTRLQIAWISLLKHHEILRTGFVETGSNIWQITFKNSPSQTIRYQTAPQDMSQESHREIAGNDLSRPPVTLIVQESGDSYLKLKLIIHHALYDGISLPSLMQQLRLLCDGQSLPAALSFRTFVGQSVEAQQRISGDSSDSNLARKQWVSYLRGISYPVQSLGDPSTVDSGKRTEVFQPAKQVSSLRKIAQGVGVSVDALLLASISKVYARYLVEAKAASAADVMFGIYLANRAPFGDDLSALAAPTLNILPLHVRDPIRRRIEDLAVDIQEDLRKISSKQMSCASLNDIYKWSGVRVNFIVNILKDAGSEVEGSNEAIFNPVVEIKRKAEVAEYSSNKNMPRTDEKFDAYLPSIDVEIRNLGNTVDIGVFAPSQMLLVNEAESMIESFVELLT